METRSKYYAKSIGIHKPVVRALLGKDADKAARAVWQHIDQSLESILSFEEQTRPLRPKMTGTR
jgi:DNA-binding GntR family transcriptional regulator